MIKTLHNKLWPIFSQYIRLRDCLKTTGTREYGACITCKQVKPFQLLDAGHFMSIRRMPTRYDERNVNAQCKACNGFRAGEQYKYGLELEKMYDPNTVTELVDLSKTTRKFKPYELQEMIDIYKAKVKEL